MEKWIMYGILAAFLLALRDYFTTNHTKIHNDLTFTLLLCFLRFINFNICMLHEIQ